MGKKENNVTLEASMDVLLFYTFILCYRMECKTIAFEL